MARVTSGVPALGRRGKVERRGQRAVMIRSSEWRERDRGPGKPGNRRRVRGTGSTLGHGALIASRQAREAHRHNSRPKRPDFRLIRPPAAVSPAGSPPIPVRRSDRARSGMTRRLRIAGTAFGALLVPACAGFQPDATVMHPVGPAQPVGVKPPAGASPTLAAKPRVVEKFAEGRTDEMPVSPFATTAERPKPPAPTG